MIIAIEAVLFLVIVFLENHHLNLPFTDTLLNAIIIANIFLLPIIILVLFLIIRVKQTKYCFLIDFFMTLLILGVVYTIQIYAATYIDYNFLHGTGRRQEFTGGLVLYYGAVFGFIFTVVASALAQVFLVVRYLKLKKELES